MTQLAFDSLQGPTSTYVPLTNGQAAPAGTPWNTAWVYNGVGAGFQVNNVGLQLRTPPTGSVIASRPDVTVPVVGSYAEFRLANLNNLLNTRFGPGLRCSGTDNTNYAFIAAASQTSWTQLGILYRVSGAASSGYAGFVVHGHSWAIDDGIRLVLTGQTPVITASVLILPAGGGTPIVVVAPTLLPTAVQQAAGLNSGFPGIVNEGGASPNVKDWAAGDLITGPQPPVPPTSPQGAFTVRTT